MMKIEQSSLFLGGIVAASILAGGCTKKQEGYVDTAVDAVNVHTTTTTTTTTTTAATTPTVVTTAPTQTGCDAANIATFTGIFASRANIEAPRMQAEGGIICGNVTEGGTVQGGTFLLEPGKCYTVVANSLPNVTEVDVALVIDASVAGLPTNIVEMAKTPIAVDSETGAMGTIGPKNACYSWKLPLPAPVKVIVKARNGSGPIGAQVYSRRGTGTG